MRTIDTTSACTLSCDAYVTLISERLFSLLTDHGHLVPPSSLFIVILPPGGHPCAHVMSTYFRPPSFAPASSSTVTCLRRRTMLPISSSEMQYKFPFQRCLVHRYLPADAPCGSGRDKFSVAFEFTHIARLVVKPRHPRLPPRLVFTCLHHLLRYVAYSKIFIFILCLSHPQQLGIGSCRSSALRLMSHK